jgi:hypothetical protein
MPRHPCTSIVYVSLSLPTGKTNGIRISQLVDPQQSFVPVRFISLLTQVADKARYLLIAPFLELGDLSAPRHEH